jgi:hypothetical protein
LDVPVNVSLSGRRQEGASVETGDTIAFLYGNRVTAFTYNHDHQPLYHCGDGMAEIGNNIAENAPRGVALGRKNFMFLGADSGGERAAAMYSLIVSAKLNGIDPLA